MNYSGPHGSRLPVPLPHHQQVLQPPPLTPASVQHQQQPVEQERHCKVCGDRAVYVNYGALTCDSCKTFFRRQNLQPKVSVPELSINGQYFGSNLT